MRSERQGEAGTAPAQPDFGLPLDTPPMDARTADTLSTNGRQWQYEPKWDGFRCLAFKRDAAVELKAKSGKPLGRYFPEIVAVLSAIAARHCVVDGELVIELDGKLSFDGFTGNAPGGQSRCSTERSGEWQRLRPELVVEVEYNQITSGRFRHGTRLIRWRPDKSPTQCTIDQIAVPQPR
jgi:ATP-dependent DNA ligase